MSDETTQDTSAIHDNVADGALDAPDELAKENAEHPAFQAEIAELTTHVAALQRDYEVEREYATQLGARVAALEETVTALSTPASPEPTTAPVGKVGIPAPGIASGDSSAGV